MDLLNPITKHHLMNLEKGTYLKRPDGGISTVSTAQDDYQGYPILYPTIWDGKELPRKEAMQRAIKEGAYVMSDIAGKKGHQQLRQFDIDLHKPFDNDISRYLGKK